MESGMFNEVFKLDKYVIKISKNDEIFNQIVNEMTIDDVKQYEKNINNVGIKTARIYEELNFPNCKVLIQEYIEGQTLEDILRSKEHDIERKLEIFKKYTEIYKLSKQNNNLCLDWNLKNFVYNGKELIYVDLTPCLYKDSIRNIKLENLIQFRDSFLDENITIAGILGYTLKALIKEEDKETVKKAYIKIKEMLEYKPQEKRENHIYLDKLSLLEDFLNSDMEKDELFDLLKDFSMKKESLESKTGEENNGNYTRKRI